MDTILSVLSMIKAWMQNNAKTISQLRDKSKQKLWRECKFSNIFTWQIIMGILGLSKVLGDYAPSCMKENEFKNYFGK